MPMPRSKQGVLPFVYSEVSVHWPVPQSLRSISVLDLTKKEEFCSVVDSMVKPQSVVTKIEILPQLKQFGVQHSTVDEFISFGGLIAVSPVNVKDEGCFWQQAQRKKDFPVHTQVELFSDVPEGVPKEACLRIIYYELSGVWELPPMDKKKKLTKLIDEQRFLSLVKDKLGKNGFLVDMDLDLVCTAIPTNETSLALLAGQFTAGVVSGIVLVQPVDSNDNRCMWKQANKRPAASEQTPGEVYGEEVPRVEVEVTSQEVEVADASQDTRSYFESNTGSGLQEPVGTSMEAMLGQLKAEMKAEMKAEVASQNTVLSTKIKSLEAGNSTLQSNFARFKSDSEIQQTMLKGQLELVNNQVLDLKRSNLRFTEEMNQLSLKVTDLQKKYTEQKSKLVAMERSYGGLVNCLKALEDIFMRKMVERFRQEALIKLEHDDVYGPKVMRDVHFSENPDPSWWCELLDNEMVSVARTLGTTVQALSLSYYGENTLQGTGGHAAAHHVMEPRFIYANIVSNRKSTPGLGDVYKFAFGSTADDDLWGEPECFHCPAHCPSTSGSE